MGKKMIVCKSWVEDRKDRNFFKNLILIYFSIEQVECHYSYNNRIYVVDSLEDSATKDFDSWDDRPVNNWMVEKGVDERGNKGIWFCRIFAITNEMFLPEVQDQLQELSNQLVE
ncbi:hypothetical protein RhiirC2_714432 [Rhizophagus irregularis]|uniref:Uncharacterized protein n=1 Tax=Rhizophagus irregularis TaxID=588596 RepID=A0A2N1MZF5_9GLOM|nr:hypothetical protein RhiirC2_714432 [Rhizophagus irregularis]